MDGAVQAKGSIICESRKKLYLTGVTDTESFDENEAVLLTLSGRLLIKGSELRVTRLSVEEGEAAIEGNIDSLIYTELPSDKKESFFTRLFR